MVSEPSTSAVPSGKPLPPVPIPRPELLSTRLPTSPRTVGPETTRTVRLTARTWPIATQIRPSSMQTVTSISRRTIPLCPKYYPPTTVITNYCPGGEILYSSTRNPESLFPTILLCSSHATLPIPADLQFRAVGEQGQAHTVFHLQTLRVRPALLVASSGSMGRTLTFGVFEDQLRGLSNLDRRPERVRQRSFEKKIGQWIGME